MSSPPGYAVGPPIGKDMAVAENTRRTDSYLYEAEREEKVPQAKSDRAGTAGEAERGEVGGAAGSLKGVTTGVTAQEVRNAFLRKVYGVLLAQSLGSLLVGWLMSTDETSAWVQENAGMLFVEFFGVLCAMGGSWWKRHHYPINVIMLGVFTLIEAITVGSVVSYFKSTIPLQALVILTVVFVGLTVSTMPLNWSYGGKAPRIIMTWIVLSTGVILYNREILMGSAQFSYPITLTTLHLAYQTIATRLLHKYTNLISGVAPAQYSAIPLTEPNELNSAVGDSKEESVALSWSDWRTKIVPPAAMFSISLVLSNWAYLYLGVAFIHMLKAFSPVAILLAAFAFRTKVFSVKLCGIVLVISLGVGLASYGESKFNLTGVIIQMAAIAIEATRVTLIQLLLQSGNEMSPLKTLYFFAPICLCLNGVLILPIEGFAALRAIPSLGLFTILSNCTLTFMLNLSSVYLIGLSSMVLSLSKVVKDILLVGGSALLLGDTLTGVQIFGYLLATVGLFWYKLSPS